MTATDTPKLDGSIVGELLLEELPEWWLGICRVEAQVNNNDDWEVVVYGENNHVIERVDITDYKKPSVLDPEQEVTDLYRVAQIVNTAVAEEYAEL